MCVCACVGVCCGLMVVVGGGGGGVGRDKLGEFFSALFRMCKLEYDNSHKLLQNKMTLLTFLFLLYHNIRTI